MEPVTKEQFSYIAFMLGFSDELSIEHLWNLYLANLTNDVEKIEKAIREFNLNERLKGTGRFN